MQQIVLEKEQVNNFRYVYTHDDGMVTKNLELEYSSPLLSEIVRVTFSRGACAVNRLMFETLSGNINLDVVPDFLGFDYHNARARFSFPNNWHIVLDFYTDEDMGTPYFSIILEEY